MGEDKNMSEAFHDLRSYLLEEFGAVVTPDDFEKPWKVFEDADFTEILKEMNDGDESLENPDA